MNNGPMTNSKIALVTGCGRPEGIGAAIAITLAEQGHDVAFTSWKLYDHRVHGTKDDSFAGQLVAQIAALGRRCLAIEADLGSTETATSVFDMVDDQMGAPNILVLSHCESVESTIAGTSVESFGQITR